MKFFEALKALIFRALNPDDNMSSKRLVLFIASVFFWIFCAVMLVTGIFSMFIATKGNIDVVKLVFALFDGIREDNKIIILGCLGLVGAQNLGEYLVAKAKVTPPDVTVNDGGQSTVVQNADSIPTDNVENVQNAENVTTTDKNQN